MLFLPCVVIRAERTGGMIDFKVLFDLTEHFVLVLPVHEPSPPALVRLSVNPLKISALVIDVVRLVKVGTI